MFFNVDHVEYNTYFGIVYLIMVETTIENTHSESVAFSEKTLNTKSPSLFGSNVEGTMIYSPAGRQKRELTSRRLMNSSERALDVCFRKKSRFRCTPVLPRNCQRNTDLSEDFFPMQIDSCFSSIQEKNLNQRFAPEQNRHWPNSSWITLEQT